MNVDKIDWRVKEFNELSLDELYDIMHLRQEVFVVEQDCPYMDADYKDQKAIHINGYYENELVAHTRIVAPGISYKEQSIGRVVSKPKYRKQGVGIALMKKSIEVLEEKYNSPICRISAQKYLIKFYNSFGFEVCSEEYLEDDLPHFQMFRS
jgi:ElaA protein